MYERSAVVLERYFTQNFYYNERNKLLSNFENYKKLIEVLEKYQDVSEAEDKIIRECEDIASQIKQIQKNQNSLYKKTLKLQEDRNTLFESIDESAIELGKKLDRIEKEIDKNNTKMKPIDQEFIDTLSRFNDKSEIRSEHGKRRRNIEKEYRNILDKTKKAFEIIDEETVENIKRMLKNDNENINIELKDIMIKNGEKEKEPFDENVVECSINFGKEMYKQEGQILVEIYDRTNNLLKEISGNAVKINKYKKNSKDSKNKIEFINVEKEYLTQFLDNERLSVGLGKKEHKKLMKEACTDFELDVEQINKLKELLLAEISGEADNKKYEELYSSIYLIDLQNKEQEFEKKLRKLNLVGKILNPINWRIVSIEKIYNTFDEIVNDEYKRDLTDYKIGQSAEMDYVDDSYEEETTENENNIINEKPKRNNKIYEEIETSNDVMGYYDNLDNESDNDEDEEIEENEYETIYPNYRNQFEEENEEKEIDNGEEDSDEDFYRSFYKDDDFYDDEEDNNVYEDLETILKNRKRRSRGKKIKTTKKKGIFGLGNKKW